MGERDKGGSYPFRPEGAPVDVSSLEWWKKAQDELLGLCRDLEEIADSLPASIDKQKCLSAAGAIGPLIKRVHHYEEEVLFPAIEQRSGGVPDLPRTLSRLKSEHFQDECFAEELTERLLLLGSGGGDVNMEATGYMLRGFFEALKRHIAFERDYLLYQWEHGRENPKV
jgi:hemerythrin-like domain-containing protein